MSRKLPVLFASALAGIIGSSQAGAALEQATPASSTPAAAHELDSPNLDEVTVTARGAELERRVAEFVSQIAAAGNGGTEGLPRWSVNQKVCPLVAGLPRQEGEFILGRISETARSAGVPLGEENCTANLYILVSSQPQELLQGMEQRNRPYTVGTYGTQYPSVFESFLKMPRAVKTWYVAVERDQYGQAMPRNREGVSYNLHAEGSFIRFSSTWQLSHAFVVVDRTRLPGVSRGQLADYVAMVGLADIKPGLHLGDAPTILKLFDATPAAATAGMSDWDRAFLEALDATPQTSKQQRDEIGRSMLHQLAH